MTATSQPGINEPAPGAGTLLTSQPWMAYDAFPAAPVPLSYGYQRKKQFYVCDPDDLIAQVRNDSLNQITLVWTPETPHLVPPDEIPSLFDAVQSRNRAHHKRLLFYAVLNTVTWSIAIAMALGVTSMLWPFHFLNLVIFGLIPLAEHSWSIYQLRAATPERMLSRRDEVRYMVWLGRSRAPWTLALVGCISLVGVVQLGAAFWFFGTAHSGIETAGIVKPAVRAGEWWRLLTGTLMHATPLHFLCNILVLVALGNIIERTFHRAYVPLVFILSALGGSICSLLFLPDSTSVGASGGIMGLLGLLLVLGWKQRDSVPRHIHKSLLISLVYTGVLGVIAYQAIDNAAHAGGLLTGLLFGMVATAISRRNGDTDVARPIYTAAIVAGGVIAMTTLVCLYRLVGLS